MPEARLKPAVFLYYSRYSNAYQVYHGEEKAIKRTRALHIEPIQDTCQVRKLEEVNIEPVSLHVRPETEVAFLEAESRCENKASNEDFHNKERLGQLWVYPKWSP